jgi:hypothetical protein
MTAPSFYFPLLQYHRGSDRFSLIWRWAAAGGRYTALEEANIRSNVSGRLPDVTVRAQPPPPRRLPQRHIDFSYHRTLGF